MSTASDREPDRGHGHGHGHGPPHVVDIEAEDVRSVRRLGLLLALVGLALLALGLWMLLA